MPRKRIKPVRDSTTIVASAKIWLDAAGEEPPPADPEDLRERVGMLVGLSRDAKELGLSRVKRLLPYGSAAERILEYLRMFLGQPIEGEELEVVSGISEYARRVREWRVEFGWPIRRDGSRYVLESNEPDAAKADLWRTLNQIRRSGEAARDKMLALFQALPAGQPVSTAQLRYVTDNKDMRRVRELRTEFGWRIMTKKTGMPELKVNEYVLIDKSQMEEHDRHIDTDALIEVLKRDGNRCQKCGWHPNERVVGDPRQYIELHHIDWHAGGGSNEPDNLATLCNVHHQRVHADKVKPAAFKQWLQE